MSDKKNRKWLVKLSDREYSVEEDVESGCLIVSEGDSPDNKVRVSLSHEMIIWLYDELIDGDGDDDGDDDGDIIGDDFDYGDEVVERFSDDGEYDEEEEEYGIGMCA